MKTFRISPSEGVTKWIVFIKSKVYFFEHINSRTSFHDNKQIHYHKYISFLYNGTCTKISFILTMCCLLTSSRMGDHSERSLTAHSLMTVNEYLSRDSTLISYDITLTNDDDTFANESRTLVSDNN